MQNTTEAHKGSTMDNLIDNSYPQLALVKSCLESFGANYAILGGFPRDLANRKTPKDLDICLWGTSPNMIQSVVEKLNDCELHFTNDNYSTHERILVVYKVGNIDLIFWNANTFTEVVDNFDANVNQYIANDSGDEAFSFLGENLGELTWVRNPKVISPERAQRLFTIADNLGWSTKVARKQWEEAAFNLATQPSQPSQPEKSDATAFLVMKNGKHLPPTPAGIFTSVTLAQNTARELADTCVDDYHTYEVHELQVNTLLPNTMRTSGHEFHELPAIYSYRKGDKS